MFFQEHTFCHIWSWRRWYRDVLHRLIQIVGHINWISVFAKVLDNSCVHSRASFVLGLPGMALNSSSTTSAAFKWGYKLTIWKWLMASSFFGRGMELFLLMRCPRKSSENISRRYRKCSASFLHATMMSRWTKANLWPRQTVFISRCKACAAFSIQTAF